LESIISIKSNVPGLSALLFETAKKDPIKTLPSEITTMKDVIAIVEIQGDAEGLSLEHACHTTKEDEN
jgi:hypothetical protein